MKILIFSDTHLTHVFDQNKYIFLSKIIQDADQVIINGDFWDSWFTSFDKFINSPWSNLFPLLLQKNTIYLYGNHDPSEKSDNHASLFAAKTGLQYRIKSGGYTYHIEHGHKLLKGKRTKWLETYGHLLDSIEGGSFGSLTHKCLHVLEYVAYKCIGPTLMTKSRVGKHNNEVLKQQNREGEFLICSDTHHAEIDREVGFANTGCILYGSASYLTIDNEKINLHRKKY